MSENTCPFCAAGWPLESGYHIVQGAPEPCESGRIAQLEAENAQLRAQVEGLREALTEIKPIFEKDYYFGHPTARKGIGIIDAALAATPAPARDEEREAEKAVVEAALRWTECYPAGSLALLEAVASLRAARGEGEGER